MKKYIILLFLIGYGSISLSQALVSVIQKGHSSVVKSTAYSPEGKYLVTASRDRTAKLWERDGGRELRTFFGHQHTVNHITYSPNGKYIATTSADNTVRVWDVETGKELFKSKCKDFAINVAFNATGDLLAVGGRFYEVIIWKWKENKEVNRIKVEPDIGLGFAVNLEFSKNGDYLFIGEDNFNSRIFSTKDWSEIVSYPVESGSCGGCVSFGSFDNANDRFYKLGRYHVFTYDLNTKEELNRYPHTFDDVVSFSKFPDQDKLMVATEEEIFILSAPTGDTLLHYTPETAGINEAILHPKSEEIAISTNDNRTIIYHLEQKQSILSLEGLLNYRDKGGILYDPNNYWSQNIAKYIRLKNPLLISADEQTLLKSRYGKNIREISLSTGQPMKELAFHKKAVLSMDLSKDGKLLAAADGDGTVLLWDIEKADTIRSYTKLNAPIFEVRFSNDNKHIIASSWNGYVLIWEVSTGELTTQLLFEKYSAYTLSFTPDDLYFITSGLNNSLEMYEIDSKQKVRTFYGHTAPVHQITFSDTGLMLTSGWDGFVREWDLATGLMKRKWQVDEPLYAISYSPDGRYILGAGADRIIRFWNSGDGSLVKVLKGHQASVVGLQFLAEGKKLISTDLDGTMKFWDLETNREVYEHIQISKTDWMVRTSDGYFTGTERARESVHFVKKMESYSTDQLFNEYYRPELMKQLFQGKNNRSKRNLQGQLQESPPPQLYLNGVKSSDGKYARLYMQAWSTGGGLKDIKFFHNGKRLVDPPLGSYGPNNDTIIYDYEIPLIAGNNVFSISASSMGGIESKKEEISIFSKLGSVAPKCHVVVVGINEYMNPQLRLNYARPDAESVAEVFDEVGRPLFDDMVIHTIYDSAATKEAILDTLTALASQVELQDVFVFYYAGHGSMVDGKFYFIPSDNPRLFDKKTLDEEALGAEELQVKFQEIKALKQMIIMDACQSGGSVDILGQRGALREKAMAQLSRSTGIHVLAAAGSEQYAMEFRNLGHGVFTYMILEALRGGADGAPDDGKVTIYELKSFLDDKVPEYSQQFSGQPQYPFTFSKGNDFPIVINEGDENE